MRNLINYDAFSILLVDHDARALRHLFSIRYDRRVNIDNVRSVRDSPAPQPIARSGTRRRHHQGPALHRSHTDIRSELAVPLVLQDRVVGVMDLESDRVGYSPTITCAR